MSDLATTSHRIPKYLAIRDVIANEIESGQLSSNTKLSSERLLSEQFSTTRVAVREALLALEMDGLIYRLDRRGWFVRALRYVLFIALNRPKVLINMYKNKAVFQRQN